MKRLGIVVSILVVALVGSLLVRVAIVESEDPLVVVHWSNSHPLREGLLYDMAKRFNDQDHETASGQPIEIKVIECESADQAEDLVARVTGGAGEGSCEDEDGDRADDPTIVTPQSDDWLVDIKDGAGPVVDPAAAKPIAEAYLGIVTYEEMAECLLSTGEPIGYADILRVAEDGWSSAGCANKASWGEEARLSLTNPSTSTTGRNVLVTLYGIAAAGATGIKLPDELTPEDIKRPEVQQWVERFQSAVDHYMPGTLALNTKIADHEGEFFLLPEDNVVSLYKGLEDRRSANGEDEPLEEVQDLKMLYPEEGSVLNSNPAGIVDAPWVGTDELHAATTWVDYLRDEEQQRAFMSAGFRPADGTGLEVDEKQYEQWGLDAAAPARVIDPGDVKPQVLDEIVSSWGTVKKPAVVTFVVDLSTSMRKEPLDQVKAGLKQILDEMEAAGAGSSKVGLVTFSTDVELVIAPVPLSGPGERIGEATRDMKVIDQTALYDAVATAIELTDQTKADAGATRAVVVLSDGVDNASGLCLHQLVDMRSGETDIDQYCATAKDTRAPRDVDGNQVAVEDVEGDQLHMDLEHPDLDVYFVGFGSADINVGRILAGATEADFQVSTDDGLASVIQALSGYF